MSVESEHVRALARSFARQLEYLRRFRGVHYVGAHAMPLSDAFEHEPSEHASPEHASPEHQPPEHQQPALASRPTPPELIANSTAAPARAPAAAKPDRASEWTPAKKLAYLRERNVGDCHRCPLANTRHNIVFGVGDPEAELMFIGEAPGADEDRRGEPFVGAAGRRLNQWIEQLGLRREQVYIANVLKCRPPNNRDPRPEEIDRCSPFLHAQIRAIEPKVIVALGRFAGCSLLGREHKLHEMRRHDHHYREPKSGAEIPLVVTYHPSYVIRSEQDPRRDSPAPAKTDRGGVIKSEDQKVLDDLRRALSLVRAE